MSSVQVDQVLLPLRYPKLWLAGGWLLVVSVIVTSLAPAPYIDKITFDISDKLLHASAYFVLMVWFGGLYRRGLHPLLGAMLLLLGVSLDLLQGLTPTRSLEVADIAADLLGILIGIVLTMWPLEGWCQRVERWLPRRAS